MATGAAPALEPKAETKSEASTETHTPHPETLKQRFIGLLHKIFAGREDHLGWHQ
jgi:hypothetical protein